MTGIVYGDEGPSDAIAEAALEVWGSDARYYPKAGEPFDLRVVFKAPRRVATAQAGGRTEKAVVTGPLAKAPRHVLADARMGDSLDVAGHTWNVHLPPETDGAVWVILRLQGPEPRRDAALP